MFRKNHHYNPNKSHHTKRGFRNDEHFAIKLRSVLAWEYERIKAKQPYIPNEGYQDFYKLWGQQANFSAQEDHIWWLGHASTLVRLNGINVLTDPVFSNRVSPFSFAGPKRCMPLPTSVEGLPHIHAVVISHSHYDHLDKETISKLVSRFPEMTILAPLGLKRVLENWGAPKVIELDWWSEVEIHGICFGCTPARHWSQRISAIRNSTLWCGWIIRSHHKTVYFMGDTSYSPLLLEVSERYSIDMAAIPIGCYSPRWFMKDQHIDPIEAVQLFKEMKLKRALAVHWGTFELSSEALDEPPTLLQQAMAQNGVSNDEFALIKVGAHLAL